METQAAPTSPIRALFRSPFRNKNKPLPSLPTDQSPARSPIAEVSANIVHPAPSASPTKNKGSNKFLSKLLGSSRNKHASTAPTTTSITSDATSPQRVTISATTTTRSPSSPADGKAKASRSPIRKHSYFGSLNKKKTGDVRSLSRKVSNLEAELQKARRELDAIAGAQKEPYAEHNDKEKEKASLEYDRRIEEKALSMSQRGRFDGLVENLLGQAPVLQPHQPVSASMSPLKPAASGGETPEADHKLKRKRSNPETAPEISWEQMQKNIAAFQMHLPSAPTNKRARKSSDSGREVPDDMDSPPAVQSISEAKRKRAHREQSVDPVAFARLVRQEKEKEKQRETEKQQDKDAASSVMALSDASRPQSRRQAGRQAPDFSSFAQSTPAANTRSSTTAHLLQSWPAPHSLSPNHEHEESSPSQPSSPADQRLPSVDICTPHLPPSLALAPTDAYSLHTDTSSIASNSSPSSLHSAHSDSPNNIDAEHRRALTEQWRLMQEDEEAADREMREIEEGEEEDEVSSLGAKPPVKRGRLVPRPTRLSRVVEEFEWDDGETF